MNHKLRALVAGAVTVIGVAGCTATGQIPSALVGSGPAATSAPVVGIIPDAAPQATEDVNGPLHGEYDPRDVALSMAYTYVAVDGLDAYSRVRLIEQLKRDGFTTAEATYAADNVSVNWSAQALKAARGWLGIDGTWTNSQMIGQLKLDGFTQAQANYAVTTLGLKDATPTPSVEVSTPPAVTPSTPTTIPSQASSNPTMGIND